MFILFVIQLLYHFCLTISFNSIGYGDIVAQNDSERLFSIVVIVLGSTGLPYIISEMSHHVFNKGSGKGRAAHQLNVARDYFIQNSSPQSWRDAMIQHFAYLMGEETAFDHRLIWSQMPHSLRTDVIQHVSREDFDNIALFKPLKTSVLCSLYMYTEHCMVTKGSFMYTFETGSGGLYFVLQGYAEVVDEKVESKDSDIEDRIRPVSLISEGMFFGHEALLKSSFDFCGIRAKSDLYTLFISTENLSRMKKEVPLVYDTLVYVLDEAVKMSAGTYELPTDDSGAIVQKFVSRIMRMKTFLAEKKEIISNSTAAQKLDSSIKNMYKWLNSDVNEAQNLHQTLFSTSTNISEQKAKKKVSEEFNKALMSDSNREKFLVIKAEKQQLEISLSEMQSNRSSSRRFCRALSRVSEEDSSRSRSLSRSMSIFLSGRSGFEEEAADGCASFRYRIGPSTSRTLVANILTPAESEEEDEHTSFRMIPLWDK